MVRLFAILSFAGILAMPFKTSGQWSTDPTQNLIVGYGLNPELASDSAGGCYVTYEQNTGYPRQLILHRLNRYGLKVWGSNGLQILGQFPEQWFAEITADGRGGVLVSYIDDGAAGPPGPLVFKSRLSVQRVDSAGHIVWDSGGVRVSLEEIGQGDQAIEPDGQGGCIVSWRDSLNTLWIQRIDSSGMRVWGDSGKYVLPQALTKPIIVQDHFNGAVIESYSITYFDRAQRILSNATFG